MGAIVRADKEKQIQEMLTPSFTIQELTSAVALILMLAWAGMWAWEAFFCTDTGRNRETRIDRSHPGTVRELGADPAR